MRIFGVVESFAFYVPSRDSFENPPGVRDVWFTNAAGQRLHGWLLVPPDASGPAPAVLHVHGNAGNVEGHLAFSRFLVDHGFAVFVFDYRGYGRSDAPGRRLQRADLMDDTRAALDALLRIPEIDPARVSVYGVSIGNAFSTSLAAERSEVRGVVAAAPFSGWSRIANLHVPVLGGLLIRGGLDPAEACAALGSRPLLLVHGGLDTIVPPVESEIIERAAVERGVTVRRVLVPEAGHNDIVYADQETREAVVGFLNAAMPPR